MILGSMPSVKSIEEAFYYAHPRNAFWPIMSQVTGHSIETVEDKTALIENNQILLWDVLSECYRAGSLDAAIKTPQANDFELLFNKFSSIKTVIFNGQKSAQLFQRLVIKKQAIPQNIMLITLPSTSPANAAMSKEDKQLFWQENLSKLL